METLAYHNANLVSLRLDFCGRLTDESFKVWTTSLPALERLELLGPFLVRSSAWQEFFKKHPKLESFLITQSPRFDLDCMTALVTYCPAVKELRLREFEHMQDAFLDEIKKLKHGLHSLDLSDPSKSCSEKALLKLVATIGKTLVHLNLSRHSLITDIFLIKGLQVNAKCLESLTLSQLPELTDAGVAKFFDDWTGNAPLLALDLSGNNYLAGMALEAILKHSAKRLEQLNINGWKDVGYDELKIIGHSAFELKKVDVGWCRAVDDFLLKEWLEGENVKGVLKGGCKSLEEIKVWGCNKVSAACYRKVCKIKMSFVS